MFTSYIWLGLMIFVVHLIFEEWNLWIDIAKGGKLLTSWSKTWSMVQERGTSQHSEDANWGIPIEIHWNSMISEVDTKHVFTKKRAALLMNDCFWDWWFQQPIPWEAGGHVTPISLYSLHIILLTYYNYSTFWGLYTHVYRIYIYIIYNKGL